MFIPFGCKNINPIDNFNDNFNDKIVVLFV